MFTTIRSYALFARYALVVLTMVPFTLFTIGGLCSHGGLCQN